MKRLCVFCGSSTGHRSVYSAAAGELGRELAAAGVELVYGGGRVGLMGIVADSVLEAGGRVVGVIPSFLDSREIAHRELTELHVVGSMHERKALMAELSDGFLALPGGLGTLEELAEILTWDQLGLQVKPIGLLNVDGFYDAFLAFVDHQVAEGFLPEAHRERLLHSPVIPDLLRLLMDDRRSRIGPSDKWLDRT